MSDFESSEALQARLENLNQLTEFSQNCRTQLTELFGVLGWSWENHSSQVTTTTTRFVVLARHK